MVPPPLDKDYNMENGQCVIFCRHRLRKSCDITIPGIVRSRQRFTRPILSPNLLADHPKANVLNFLEVAMRDDIIFNKECKVETVRAIYEHQEEEYRKLREAMETVSDEFAKVPFHNFIHESTPVNAIRTATEHRLWHQRLLHINDATVKNAHLHVTGVPDFSGARGFDVLDNCPTCIQAKLTKLNWVFIFIPSLNPWRVR